MLAKQINGCAAADGQLDVSQTAEQDSRSVFITTTKGGQMNGSPSKIGVALRDFKSDSVERGEGKMKDAGVMVVAVNDIEGTLLVEQI